MFDFRPRPRTRGILIHDSHTGPEIASALAWLRVNGRAQGLVEIGYHFLVERDGKVYGVRPVRAMGSHAPGLNHEWIGVCWAGGGPEAPLTAAQQEGLMALFSYIHGEFPGAPLEIKGHSEVQRQRNRARCPANDMDALRAAFEEYRTMVDHLLPCQTVAPDRAPGDLSPQCRLVIDYLQERGPLTNLLALTVLAVGSLSKRIAELRASGYDIVSEEGKGYHGNRYARYRLASDNRAQDAEQPQERQGR